MTSLNQNEKPKQKPKRKRPRNLRLNNEDVLKRDSFHRGGGWNANSRDAYLYKVKRMGFKRLRQEIRDLKAILADNSAEDMEHHTVARKTKAAYKMSALLTYLDSLL